MIEWLKPFESYMFLDVEASGLHRGSFPIEIGVCGVDLAPSSKLIRPIGGRWPLTEWSPASEKIHGIGWMELQADGADAADVATWLNAACHDKMVLSDNPEPDAQWCHKLFHDTGIDQGFSLHDSWQLEAAAAAASRLAPGDAQGYIERIRRSFPHPHRAGPDARGCCARFLVLAVPHMLDELEAMA